MDGGYAPPTNSKRVDRHDSRTLPPLDTREEWQLDDGRRVEVSRWKGVRMRKWPSQALQLYRVIEYKADGKPRYKRPLWLLFVAQPEQEVSPTAREAEAIYDERFSVEHGIRFLKGDLGLTCGQFNGLEAEGRVQVWVEVVGTAFWFLWALRSLADAERENLPGWWRSGKLTPGAVRKQAHGLLLSLGWSKHVPQSRGKSPGRAEGMAFAPRARFKAYCKAAQ